MEQLHLSSSKKSSEWVSSLQQKGYLFLKDYIDRSKISLLRKKVLEVLYEEGWITTPDDSYVVKEPVRPINSPEFYRAIDRFMQIEFLHFIARDQVLLDLMKILLKEDSPFPHPRKMVRTSYPTRLNKKDLIPPHQDIFYVRGEVDTFTVWVPLGDYSSRQGGLKIAEGSHLRKQTFPTSPHDDGRFGCTVADIDDKEFLWKHSSVEMGDIIVFHSLTLHAAIPNLENQIRIAMDCRFSSSSGVINEEQLIPPYHPHVREWRELSQEWVKPNFFDIPSTLTLKPPSEPLYEVLKRSSNYVVTSK